MNRLITTFDEVPPSPTIRRSSVRRSASQRSRTWCFLENVYRRSLSSGPDPRKSRSFFKTETRKDFAVHVSLSSSSLVKQPEIRRSQRSPRSQRPSKLQLLHLRGAWKPGPTAIGNRQLSAADALIELDGCSRGTKARWGPEGSAAPRSVAVL